MQYRSHDGFRSIGGATALVPSAAPGRDRGISAARALGIVLALAAGAACGTAPDVGALPPPRTIDELRTRPPVARLQREQSLASQRGFSSYLVSYRSAGLKVHALVAVPASPRPKHGYPVLVANHGFHPDPPRYGFAAGVDSRPGDYYRPAPALYTSRGYLVVMPDFLGHNLSEGGAYAHGALAPAWYTEDVVALLVALRDLPDADLDNVFLWGHSMGGDITLRALLVADRISGIAIRAASLWSSSGGDLAERASIRSKPESPVADAGSAVPRPGLDALNAQVASLAAPYDWRANEPLGHLGLLRTPLILHHAREDSSTRHEWSEQLARELSLRRLPHRFHSHSGGDHFFQGDAQRLAADRDDAYFRERMTGVRAAESR